MQTSEKIDQIAAALAKVQDKLTPVKPNTVNPFFKSNYADLSAVSVHVRDLAAANGLSVSQGSEQSDGTVIHVITILMHTSGQWIRSCLSVKPAKTVPQDVGSAMTYARRYALAAIFGMSVSGDDDDGNTGAGHGPASNRNAPPPQREAPAKPAEPSRKDQLFAMIDKWSGIGGADRAAAIRDTIAAYGFKVSKDKPLTDAQIEDVGRLINTDIATGKKWADIVK